MYFQEVLGKPRDNLCAFVLGLVLVLTSWKGILIPIGDWSCKFNYPKLVGKLWTYQQYHVEGLNNQIVIIYLVNILLSNKCELQWMNPIGIIHPLYKCVKIELSSSSHNGLSLCYVLKQNRHSEIVWHG
jgi:hypothetical protein